MVDFTQELLLPILLQGEVLASLLVEDGVQTVSIISRADSYGRGLAEATAFSF